MIKTAAIVALIGMLGCSFIGVRSQPTAPLFGDGPVTCNGYGLPIADGVVSVAGFGVVALGLASAYQRINKDEGPGILLFGLSGLAIGLVETAAAIHGFHAAHRCRTDETLRDEKPVAEVTVRREATTHSYCTVSPTGALGWCGETIGGCERIRAIHVASTHQMTACAEQLRVVCFGYRTTDGEGHVSCAPTVPACNAIRGGLEYRRGISTLQECAEMPLAQREQPGAAPAATAPPPAIAPAVAPEPAAVMPPPPPVFP